jgi:hypothetical protein
MHGGLSSPWIAHQKHFLHPKSLLNIHNYYYDELLIKARSFNIKEIYLEKSEDYGRLDKINIGSTKHDDSII